MKTIFAKNLIPIFTIAISTMMIGCASFPNFTPYSGTGMQSYSPGMMPSYSSAMMVQNLYGAGFVPMPANTYQTDLFESLPPNRITAIQRNGNTYYAYADPATHQVLMGHGGALKNYESLVKRKFASVASTAQRAEKNFAENALTSPQRRSLATEGGRLKNFWRNMTQHNHQHHVASAPSNTLALGSSKVNVSTKELSAPKEVENKIKQEWKKINI